MFAVPIEAFTVTVELFRTLAEDVDASKPRMFLDDCGRFKDCKLFVAAVDAAAEAESGLVDLPAFK
jgi:hypothetical protein